MQWLLRIPLILREFGLLFSQQADLAKRSHEFGKARRFFLTAIADQPEAHQVWLEYAKMEEERGNFHRARRILYRSLQFCPTSEALLVKAIKHEERMRSLKTARAILARLEGIPLENSWRVFLEGAQMEARTGSRKAAARIFDYLKAKAFQHGPVLLEAFRFAERFGRFDDVKSVLSM